MPYFSFRVYDGAGVELSVLRSVLEAPDATLALAEARRLYPGKVIEGVHLMDAGHGQREDQATRWLDDLPQPLQFLAMLFVVVVFAVGVMWHDLRRKGDVGH